jgi:hypothetical protein
LCVFHGYGLSPAFQRCVHVHAAIDNYDQLLLQLRIHGKLAR